MTHVTAGSCLRVIWYAAHTWWYQRCFLGFFCFATCSPAGAPVLSEFLRAMPLSLVGRAGQQARGLLARRRRLREVRERLGDLHAATRHRLAPQPARAVRRAHERTRHDAQEPDLLGRVGELDELLGLDPPVDRVVTQRRAQVLGDGHEVAA